RAAAAAGARRPAVEPQLDVVMLFGFLAAFITLVCWLRRRRSRSVYLALAACLAASAAYGFLQGAWPLGILEAAWSAAAVHRWWAMRGSRGWPGRTRRGRTSR